MALGAGHQAVPSLQVGVLCKLFLYMFGSGFYSLFPALSPLYELYRYFY